MMTGEVFGQMPDGTDVERFTIAGGDLTLNILTYGAVIQDARLDGHAPSLVLGLDEFSHYLDHSPFFGAIAGRCANRIGGGAFSLDGTTYQLDRNQRGKHSLHGGTRGMGKRVWDVVDVRASAITLRLEQADGDMGYPGRLVTDVTYSCLADGVLDIAITAETDAPTLCNIAHHSYWNLDGTETLAQHELQLDADHYTAVDPDFIPTGDVRDVTGTRFDFRISRPVLDETIIDHNLCLSERKQPLRKIGTLTSKSSGLSMTILTTEPGLQIYDGNKMNITVPGLDGQPYERFGGIALEPQIWPDAINHANFPDPVLRPGETYHQHTQFRFEKG